MRNWEDRTFAACTECGHIYIATPTRAGPIKVQTSNCRNCGGTTFELLDV